MAETEGSSESPRRMKVGKEETLHPAKKGFIFKPSAKFKYEAFELKWPEEKEGEGEMKAAEGVAEKENPLEYAKFEFTFKVSVSSVSVQYDYSKRDLTPADSIREMGEQLKEDHTLWVKLLTESKSPLEKLLVDHEVGRVEFERFEGAVDYENNSITGTWAVKFGAFAVKFLDLQGELKFEFSLAKGERGKKPKWLAANLTGAFKPFTAPDFKLVDGIVIKGPAIEVELEAEVEPNWSAIGRRVLEEAKELLPEVIEALTSDTAIVAGEVVLAAAVIYLAYKTIDRLREDAKAFDDIEGLESHIQAAKDEICRGFIDGVQKSVREHPEPGTSAHGLGMQLGAVGKQQIGTELRRKHGQDLLVDKQEFDYHFDDYIVKCTSNPQVQQDLLAKCKASGQIDSLARCVVFAAWADNHSGQTPNTKMIAWSHMFPGWNNNGSIAEKRTLLRALGRLSYRAAGFNEPSESLVAPVAV